MKINRNVFLGIALLCVLLTAGGLYLVLEKTGTSSITGWALVGVAGVGLIATITMMYRNDY